MAATATERDPGRRAEWVLLAAGALGLAVLAAGAAQFAIATAAQRHSGLAVRIEGFHLYDGARAELHGPAATDFGVDEAVAARVDWAGVPAGTRVSAEWWDGSGAQVSAEGPRAAGAMPAVVPLGEGPQPAGDYLFVVQRWEGDTAVEVIARGVVHVS